jgi:hypothetical protein
MTYGETKLPAIQVVQVEDNVASVTAEYVPAKASDEEYVHVDSNTNKRLGEQNERTRRKDGGGGYTFFEVKSSLASRKWE